MKVSKGQVREMKQREKNETRAQEKAESPAYQRLEKRLGVEKHKQPKGRAK